MRSIEKEISLLYILSVEEKVSHKLYNQIADEICRRIADRVYTVGGRLPAHRELALEFKVSTRTVYKALAMLKERGVFRPTPRGSFITGHGLSDNGSQVIVIAAPQKDQLSLKEDPLKAEICTAAKAAGYEVVLLKLNRNNFKSWIDFYNQDFCGGIVFIYSTGYQLLKYGFEKMQVPYVCTNYLPGKNEHSVWMDWKKKMFKTAGAKLQKGFCRPAVACAQSYSNALAQEYMDCWSDVCNYYGIKNYSPSIEFFTRKLKNNLAYWFAGNGDHPDCILCFELPLGDRQMFDTLQFLQKSYPSVMVYCDIKWSEFGFSNCEYFGSKNNALFRHLGEMAWKKLMLQKENKIGKNKEDVC